MKRALVRLVPIAAVLHRVRADGFGDAQSESARAAIVGDLVSWRLGELVIW